MTTSAGATTQDTAGFELSPQQVAYFRTFGFLKLPGLFRSDIGRIREGFDAVFAEQAPDFVLTQDPLQQTDNPTFPEKLRRIIHPFVERSDRLRWLLTDHRVLAIARALLGDDFEAGPPSDGSIFDCDTSWHPDLYTAPLDRFHVKLSFYLDPQRHETGAVRVIPGTNHYDTPYATELRANLYGHPTRVQENYGVAVDEIPSWTLETDPGDVVCWNYRTMHASFRGFHRRRLLSLSYRETKVNGHASA